MENGLLEFDIGLGMADEGIDIETPNDDEQFPDNSLNDANNSFGSASSETAFPLHAYIGKGEGDLDLDLKPYEGMEFESEEAAKAFYNSYARRVGFSTRVSSSRRSRKDGSIIQRSFVCAKEGFRNPNEKRTKDREIKRPRTVTRVGCKALLSIKIQDSGKWVVSSFIKEHNHELVPPDQVHSLRSHRQISGPAKTLIDTLQAAGMGPRRIMSVLIKEYGGISKVGFTEVDCRNYMRNNKHKSMEGDIQMLLDYLKQKQAENPTFFYAVQRGDENNPCLGNVFWADPKSRADYTHFGDTVTFDTTYRSNRYRMPFVPFMGLNHHCQPVLFGCAFLTNESEVSFTWLFETWLAAMSVGPPVSITTEHDPIIGSAVVHVFPNAHHRFCKWHIFKQCQEKLSTILLKQPQFEAAFHKCVNLAETPEEFESGWHSLIGKYGLGDHKWVQAAYADRGKWVPAYLRDTFFAETSTAQRGDGINSYFDGYVNASTNLSQFFKLYEKALESRHEKEIRADFDTMNTPPLLKTPSPMEKQASKLYTRKIFTRFQEELVSTLTCTASQVEDGDVEGNDDVTIYRVAKFGEEHKAYHVRFNILEMKASCSCRMFEFSGLLCRHVLAVFRVTNVLTLPSHYILKRWTRSAKSSVVLMERVTYPLSIYKESHIVRYNTLRHEALKFVDEGAETVESYDVALAALVEAWKKVPLAVRSGGKHFSSLGPARDVYGKGGVEADQCGGEGQGSSALQLSENDMDKKIHELSLDLESANRKCEVYRANLLSLLKDIEDHKQCLSIEVENIKLSMKDDL